MNNPTTLVTGTASFGRCTAEGHELFKVTAGVPAKEALEKIGCTIDAAWSVALEIAMQCDADPSVWAVVYLLEAIKASTLAVLDGLQKSSDHAARGRDG